MINTHTHQELEFFKLSTPDPQAELAPIAIEAEVNLNVNGQPWLSFRCSPDNLEELAVGFLYNEAFIQSTAEIAAFHLCDANTQLDVWLTHACPKPEQWSRTSDCQGGICLSRPVNSTSHELGEPYQTTSVQNQIKTFLAYINQMGEQRSGVHSTLLLDGQQILSANNDIGRHNTLDKIAGDCLIRNISPTQPVLLSTGRISSDMVFKAHRMGVGLVISLHSVSSLAIEAGAQLGIVLIGHARSSRLSVYTHPELILL